MKLVGVEEARAQLADLLDAAQTEPICITKRGKPIAIVTGVSGQDLIELVGKYAAPAPRAAGRPGTERR